MGNKQRLCAEADCTGCWACRNTCPKDAILVRQDEMKRELPAIDESKCIDCGLCGKACPTISSIKRQDVLEEPACYAIWTNSVPDQKTCSSGGVATALSRHIIQNGGVVFGADYDEGPVLRHRMVSDEAGLEPLKGSKYVQSDIGFTYRQAKAELEAGRRVLFIGTPCQIAGLYGFLRKEYDNLLTADLICHGTPPMAYLREYIGRRHPHAAATSVTFRGEHDFDISIYSGEQVLSRVSSKEDGYFKMFTRGVIFRSCCYRCPYANTNRIADVTLGDFYGIDIEKLQPGYSGRVSVMLVNNEKGRVAFEETSYMFTYFIRKLDVAVDNNGQLSFPTEFTKKCRRFKVLYPKIGLMPAMYLADFDFFIRRLMLKTKFGQWLRRAKRTLFKKLSGGGID